jgi:hypothetical protein
MGTLKSGIRATGSTLDPHGLRTNVYLNKFTVVDFGLCKFGGEIERKS